MKENTLEPSSNRERLAVLFESLYAQASAFGGAPIQFPLEINNTDFTVSFFGEEGGRLTFGLFIGEQKYSRKTLDVRADGSVEEDSEGIIPESDKTDHEPDFSAVSDEEITLSVLEKLETILRENSQEEVGKEKVLEMLLANGTDDPETRELVIRWTEQQEALVAKENTSRAAIVFNVERADLYVAAGDINEALECLEDARTQAHQENEAELYVQIMKKMDDLERQG